MNRAYLFLMIAASLVLGGCGPSEPVRLGFLAGMSGRSADLGEAARNGVQLAIEQQNLKGGINGRKIELLIRDDRDTPEVAAQGATELAAAGVVAIIGPITSAMVEAALPVVNKAQLVMMSPTATAMQLVGQDDYLFRINATTRDYAHLYAEFQYRLGIRRVAIAQDVRNRVFTQSWLDQFRPAYAALGGDIASVVTFESSATTAFAEVVARLIKSRPDGLLFIAATVDVARLAQQARQRSTALPLVAVEWAASDSLYELGGTAVEGLHVVESYNRNDRSPRYVTFVSAYRERFGQEPSYTSVNAHDAATAVLDALARGGRDLSVKAALLTLGPFAGLQQAIAFDRFGDASRKGYVMMMREGRLVSAQ